MVVCLKKISSAINLTYSGQPLFSYICMLDHFITVNSMNLFFNFLKCPADKKDCVNL